MKKKLIISICILMGIALFFRIFCGIFVIQPIGAIPDGTTIVYWRSGSNMPFIGSADGLLEKSGSGVSLLGRGVMLGNMADIVLKKEIFRVGYSKTLYLISTGGKEFDR